MSIRLDLPKELERELTTEATQMGVSLAEYVLRLLSTRSSVEAAPATGAELIAYWQSEGLLGTRSRTTDSQALARQLRHKVEKRIRE